MKKLIITSLLLLCCTLVSFSQWSKSGNLLYPTDNNDNVGIGINLPAYILHVARASTEPHITVQNLGSNGGATFRMIDNLSGADFKFKSTFFGDFKIRDEANLLDVLAIKGDGTGWVRIGTGNPTSKLDVDGVIKATGGNSFNWNTAFSWGNHAAVGYLSSETDPSLGQLDTCYVPKWNGDSLINGSIFDDGSNIGIGTNTPSANLDVEGTFQLKDGTEANNKILKSDADGNASWEALNAETLFGELPAISNDLCLELSGSLAIGTAPESVAIAGNYAYVVDNISDDLKVIDVSNPASPSLSGTLAIGSQPNSVAVAGNYAYVVDAGSGDLKVIDVSNPTVPSLSGSLAIGSQPRSVAVAGNYAYVVDDGSDDLKVIDVSNPTSPTLSGSLVLAISFHPKSVAVAGNYAYVVDFDYGDLKVIDISNPASPSLSGSLGTGLFSTAVAISGTYAYVVIQISGELKVIDVSNPASPTLSGFLAIGFLPTSVAVVGNYAYVVDRYDSDLKVIDISNPASPSLSGNLAIGPAPNSVAVDGNYAYVVDEDSKDLKVIRLNCINEWFPVIDPINGEISFQKLLWGQDSNANSIYSLLDRPVGIGVEAPDGKLEVRQTGTNDIFNLYYNTTNVFTVRNNGMVGIGTSFPTSDLHIQQSVSDPQNPLTGGITLQQDGSSNEWQIWNSNPYCSFAFNDVRVSYISNLTGDWITTSDKRFKKDIEPMEDVLNRVLELKPVKYRYNHTDNHVVKQRGFIAQDVMELFPDLVYTEDSSQLALARADYGILAIKAIQEQQKQLDDQKELIALSQQGMEEMKNAIAVLQDELQKKNEQISALLNQMAQFDIDLQKCCLQHHSNTVPGSTVADDKPHLAQNIPNPFNEKTIIKYYLPNSAKDNGENAILRVMDLKGVVLWRFDLVDSGYGQVDIDANTFAPGTYIYELIIGDDKIDSKKMTIAK